MDIQPKKDVHLASHTVFKVGGTARFFHEANTKEDLVAGLRWAKKYDLPFFILGAGSNTLAARKEFPGLVIKSMCSSVAVMGNSIVAEAGAMMPRVSARALAEGLSGFEWASGVPGTVGGSVRGNAGCFGKSMADVVESVEVYDALLDRQKKIAGGDCDFAYRSSIFKRHPEYVVLAATISLAAAERAAIQERMRSHALHRVSTQDIGAQCAGCAFKNVAWDDLSRATREKLFSKIPEAAQFKNATHLPAAFLLDRLGLKGYAIGAAMVSKKHANFLINTGGATAHEIAMLVSHCKEHVHRTTGILLEEEIQYL